MQKKKMTLSSINGKLSRAEMKGIMGGACESEYSAITNCLNPDPNGPMMLEPCYSNALGVWSACFSAWIYANSEQPY